MSTPLVSQAQFDGAVILAADGMTESTWTNEGNGPNGTVESGVTLISGGGPGASLPNFYRGDGVAGYIEFGDDPSWNRVHGEATILFVFRRQGSTGDTYVGHGDVSDNRWGIRANGTDAIGIRFDAWSNSLRRRRDEASEVVPTNTWRVATIRREHDEINDDDLNWLYDLWGLDGSNVWSNNVPGGNGPGGVPAATDNLSVFRRMSTTTFIEADAALIIKLPILLTSQQIQDYIALIDEDPGGEPAVTHDISIGTFNKGSFA